IDYATYIQGTHFRATFLYMWQRNLEGNDWQLAMGPDPVGKQCRLVLSGRVGQWSMTRTMQQNTRTPLPRHVLPPLTLSFGRQTSRKKGNSRETRERCSQQQQQQ
ncbi:unnamed protein product, partial [Ectocarpus sp. 12 AP-2014]